MKRFLRPVTGLPRYSAAALQLVVDGYTVEDAASYIGCDVELVEDALEMARRHLRADTLEHAAAVALHRGLIV